MTSFTNEPLLELRRRHVREQAARALAELDDRLPLAVPISIGGRRAEGTPFRSVDPGRPEQVVAIAQGADAAHVEQAVERAQDGVRAWGGRSADERAATLRRAAGALRAQRVALAALAVRECAKPWPEADADVCEAIDFLEFYARGVRELELRSPLVQMPGESNTRRFAPRGVTAVIAPWNFPFAIAAGMTAAALATGNAVILKPAEQSPACAFAIVDALHDAGVPGDALALLPGGDAPGAALVEHPGVHTIAFTGSGAVGLGIIERAAAVVPGQRHVKRVVAEMGGKNCVIVDADADLDDVVPAIVRSAFGFAGQKCSAASRVLVHREVADLLAERLGGAIAALEVGPASAFSCDVPPLIDRASQERVQRFLALGRESGAVVGSAEQIPEHGWYAAPTAFRDLPGDSPLIEQEIFGPVLAIETVPDVRTACELVDASPFALTGGLFTRSPATIDYVAAHVPLGNLYVNREITGAMVGRQPFGGNRLSGIGMKAGGPDYLLQFAEERVVTENTVRHGLVV